ncbi:MAG TPA: alpha/beta fold hydrolase [Dehalococcoidia bacterium]|nr:alpha/beta fold hydrolase [Dehalococcoidia bacterium]
MTLEERGFELMSDGLRLEARLHEGDGRLAAAVLHPHPQYGGDMDNHVVMAVCEALAEAGVTTLRFNFRGTGASEGSYDDGRGEACDARAAIVALRALTSDAPVLLAGYSFGAMVAAAVATDSELAGLALISPPLSMAGLPALPEKLPVLVMAGDRDAISPAREVLALASDQVRAVAVPGADHGWWPGIDALKAEMLAFERRMAL